MSPEGKLARSLHPHALVWITHIRIDTTRCQISPRFIHYDADVEASVSLSQGWLRIAPEKTGFSVAAPERPPFEMATYQRTFRKPDIPLKKNSGFR